MKIYDAPLICAASADDALFSVLKKPDVVGEGAFLPTDWLENAQSVVSFFLPFTNAVKESNRILNSKASDEWLHARIEGQMVVNALAEFLCSEIKALGFDALTPAADSRFKMIAPTASNWSERHIAYVCGLGTFGLSRGLITKAGMAGRIGSIVTSAKLPVTKREYESPFEYCIMCGKCAVNCPVNAIDVSLGVENGKDQVICGRFVNSTKLPPHGPNQRKRYGCGKCQVAVPCESRIPKKSAK